MSLELYYHPLASYCWKALVALYEHGTAFVSRLVDLADETSRAEFFRVWPIGKFPVLRDSDTGLTIPESTIVIEYLCERYPGEVQLIPRDPERARVTRYYDRFFDLYVHEPMQKIVGDRIRPPGANDPYGVRQAQAQLEKSYGMLESEVGTKPWCTGEEFSMADCAAAPALYYANLVWPIHDRHKNLNAYLERLLARPAFARVLREAQPYFHMFPHQPGPGETA